MLPCLVDTMQVMCYAFSLPPPVSCFFTSCAVTHVVPHTVFLDMGSTCKLSGINVWNYNKSNEDSLRGVREVSIFGDGELIGKQEFRIAPGCDGVVYKQRVCFRDVKQNCRNINRGMIRYITPTLRQDYEPPFNLSGMLWRIDIYSNYGDGYYGEFNCFVDME